MNSINSAEGLNEYVLLPLYVTHSFLCFFFVLLCHMASLQQSTDWQLEPFKTSYMQLATILEMVLGAMQTQIWDKDRNRERVDKM